MGGIRGTKEGRVCGCVYLQGGAGSSSTPLPWTADGCPQSVCVCMIAQDSRPQGHSLSQNPAPPPLGYTENTHFLSPTQQQVGYTQTAI